MYICRMASIQRVYNGLRDLMNKQQKGFIGLKTFNSLASIAQRNIYNKLFEELGTIKTYRASNVDSSRYKSRKQAIEEELARFVVRDQSITLSSGKGDSPLNMHKLISIVTDKSNRTAVELVYDIDRADRIIKSNLSAPSATFPVAVITDKIEVFPTNTTSAYLTYYRSPGSLSNANKMFDAQPTYSVLSLNVSGGEVFDPVNSRNFALSDEYEHSIVMEMAKLVGLNLRDSDAVTLGTQESQQ